MSLFRLEVVTPERSVYGADVTMVVAPTIDGQIGILAGHIPLVTVLAAGVLRVKTESEAEQCLAVSGGYLEMSHDNNLTILAPTAELGEEIDVERARQSLARAQGRLNGAGSEEVDVLRAEVAMQRAMARLRAAGVED